MLLRVSARCIIVNKGLILVQLSKHGDFYRLPGGRVRPEETILQGLQRELREELGLEELGDTKLLYIVDSFYRRRNGIVHEIGFYFLCDPANKDKLHPKEEHLRITWLPLGELTPENFRPSTLAGYLKKLADVENPFQVDTVYLVNIDVGEE